MSMANQVEMRSSMSSECARERERERERDKERERERQRERQRQRNRDRDREKSIETNRDCNFGNIGSLKPANLSLLVNESSIKNLSLD